MANILIVDDEVEMLESLEKIFSRRKEYKITTSQNSSDAMKKVNEEKFDLVLTDLKMKEHSGIDILKATLEKSPTTKVIIISGYGTIEASVEAMKEGAFDFIEKPFTSKKLFECIDRSLNARRHKSNESDSKEVQKIAGIVYKSRKMQELIDFVKKIAPGNMNVLINGESGTGKELIARAIHYFSKGNLDPFVPVNCGALPEHLFESELFGHEKGAFTGAIKTKPGLLEFANHGTFFFDEIGDMSLALQSKLLRMLEERKIRRVGGQSEIDIDVRIIAATNKNLVKAVEDRSFREDIYYRLNTIQIEIPPLRDRKDDIIPLAQNFLKEYSNKNDKLISDIAEDAQVTLYNYAWPGNIREVQNIIGRSYFLCNSKIIQKKDLPINTSNNESPIAEEIIELNYKKAKNKVLEEFEVNYLTHYLKKNKGNITKTADDCGLDRRSIYRLLKRYNIIYQSE